jgi:hypothetical protein
MARRRGPPSQGWKTLVLSMPHLFEACINQGDDRAATGANGAGRRFSEKRSGHMPGLFTEGVGDDLLGQRRIKGRPQPQPFARRARLAVTQAIYRSP